MLIYTRAYNAHLGQMVTTSEEVTVTFRSAVDTVNDLPISDNSENDVRFLVETNHLYIYKNGTWLDQGHFDTNDLMEERLFQGLS